ncbi:mitochondrial inner membrane translocase complex [Striga asiatica]|uniref:Large ribosomal subunit protein mL45 n=1 Tax=Striga asiatica TaxID=4170 RepID=A0A5A7PR11_STRAF|nr:mitochondrial inner membrane translocase complex [Striga asiatica]
MARVLAQSRRRILPLTTPSRWWVEQPLEPSTWTLKLEAQSPNISCIRLLSMQANPTAQARPMGSMKVSMTSPGFVYDPYSPREPISFLSSPHNAVKSAEILFRPNLDSQFSALQQNSNKYSAFVKWFTRSGWKRLKEDIILELKSAYAIAKLRKSGYSKKKFYEEAAELYKEINAQIANGDKGLLRKSVTENMYSVGSQERNQAKGDSLESCLLGTSNANCQNTNTASSIGKATKFDVSLGAPCWYKYSYAGSTLMLASDEDLIGVDRNDLNKVFVQLTLEFLSKQKFEAYDSSGAVVAGDKNKEILEPSILSATEHLKFLTGNHSLN